MSEGLLRSVAPRNSQAWITSVHLLIWSSMRANEFRGAPAADGGVQHAEPAGEWVLDPEDCNSLKARTHKPCCCPSPNLTMAGCGLCEQLYKGLVVTRQTKVN